MDKLLEKMKQESMLKKAKAKITKNEPLQSRLKKQLSKSLK